MKPNQASSSERTEDTEIGNRTVTIDQERLSYSENVHIYSVEIVTNVNTIQCRDQFCERQKAFSLFICWCVILMLDGDIKEDTDWDMMGHFYLQMTSP